MLRSFVPLFSLPPILILDFHEKTMSLALAHVHTRTEPELHMFRGLESSIILNYYLELLR